jgi:hypothetical protein
MAGAAKAHTHALYGIFDQSLMVAMIVVCYDRIGSHVHIRRFWLTSYVADGFAFRPVFALEPE